MPNLSKEEMREYMKLYREGRKGGEKMEAVKLEKGKKEVKPERLEVLNECDRSFELHRPGYYLFEAQEKEGVCMLPSCMKKFRTRLRYNRFCCYAHQRERLETLSMN